MIGVADALVGMRHLRDRQQGQQNQTHDEKEPNEAGLTAAGVVRACLSLRRHEGRDLQNTYL